MNDEIKTIDFLAGFQGENELLEEESEKYLTFFVDEQLYAVPTSQIIEIISMQPITFMPKLPSFIKGVINIRGKVVPLIELQQKFKGTSHVYDEQTCIVVIEALDAHVGMIVNRVNDVADIAQSQISPAPKVSIKDSHNDIIIGIAKLNGNNAMVLDCKKVLDITDTDESASE